MVPRGVENISGEFGKHYIKACRHISRGCVGGVLRIHGSYLSNLIRLAGCVVSQHCASSQACQLTSVYRAFSAAGCAFLHKADGWRVSTGMTAPAVLLLYMPVSCTAIPTKLSVAVQQTKRLVCVCRCWLLNGKGPAFLGAYSGQAELGVCPSEVLGPCGLRCGCGHTYV